MCLGEALGIEWALWRHGSKAHPYVDHTVMPLVSWAEVMGIEWLLWRHGSVVHPYVDHTVKPLISWADTLAWRLA